jgi:hypothetical protein
MGKMSELNLFVSKLKHCGEALIGISESLSELITVNDAHEYVEAVKDKPGVPENKPITLEEVRAVLAEKSRAGFTAEVRTLLEKHGAGKLSEVDPSKYPLLLQESVVLGNG